MKLFLKARMSRRGRRDGKIGLPMVDAAFPAEIESLKKAAVTEMSLVMKKWRSADTQMAASVDSARATRESLQRELSGIEAQLAEAESLDASLRGVEQERLDAHQLEKDQLERRRDAGEFVDGTRVAPLQRQSDAAPVYQEDAQDRLGKIKDLREDKDNTRAEMNSRTRNGISFWFYGIVLVALVAGEFPLNFLGFRVLRETDTLTYLIAVLPALILAVGAHLAGQGMRERVEETGKRPRWPIAVILGVAFALVAVFALRIAYIDSRLAEDAKSPTPTVVKDDSLPTAPPSPSEVPSSDESTNLSNTALGFLGLNYGAFIIALALSYAYHGARGESRWHLTVIEWKLARLHSKARNAMEDDWEAAQEQGEDVDKERPRRKLSKKEEEERLRAFERAISVHDTAMAVDQANRRVRDTKMDELRKRAGAYRENLDKALNDEGQRRIERQGRATQAKDRLIAIARRWEELLQNYRRGNMRGRQKSDRGAENPAGFLEANCKVEIPEEFMSDVTKVISS